MRATDMTQGRPARLIMAFALPMMAGNVCQQLYTLVDGAFVGRFAGIDALAAVGAADWLCWIFMGIVTGCTQGFSILISQRFGAHDGPGLKGAVAQSVLMTGLISLAVILLSQGLAVPILRLLHTPEDIFPRPCCTCASCFSASPFFPPITCRRPCCGRWGIPKHPCWPCWWPP